jgi:ATP-dependent Lhr-like helicase
MRTRFSVHTGRFVTGFAGEQFALPEAIGALREVRRKGDSGVLVSLSGADPLNLAGVLTPGPRLAGLTRNRVLYRDGIPIALLEGGEIRFLETLEAGSKWEARKTLLRSSVPPPLTHLS